MPFYVYNGDDIIARCDNLPDIGDLSKRGESVVMIDEFTNDIADYRVSSGRLVKK
jgi:hypothetical protein